MTASDLALLDGYRELLEDLKRTVAAARWRSQRTALDETGRSTPSPRRSRLI